MKIIRFHDFHKLNYILASELRMCRLTYIHFLFIFFLSWFLLLLPCCLQQSSPKKRILPPVKFLEGEVIWAKFNRRPWWPCEVVVDPEQGIYHRVKGNDRPCRLYHVRTFGEPVELAWVEGKAIHTFKGGFEFEQLPLLRRRGKQREENYKYTVIIIL
uniref:PWWP domain-containing protein n=1 Tax=Myripristis murdjan TaxID=586833 RepID=A0A667Z8G7_9TELE